MQRLAFLQSTISSSTAFSEELQTIKLTKANKVGTIWLNRPSSLNAISSTLVQQLDTSLKEFSDDPQIKVILIRSTNKKAFCAGADLKSFFQHYAQTGKIDQSPNLNLQNRFLNSRKPIISIVQGIAFGGGFELALLSDIIICSEKANFKFPELNRGIFPALGGTQIFSRLLGTKMGMKAILLVENISAIEANNLDIAILFSEANFDRSVTNFVNKLISFSQSSMQLARTALKQASSVGLQHGLAVQSLLVREAFRNSKFRKSK